ncbi:hypothetical protein JO84_gp293 [Aureococcus anophagefferens virus]|uniref:Uncharacterized protein n=1 Tax=Aureococcus anophagefferens virus TaxID=1474867 RepID=A0A076FMQ9_9VIRU|nr:hypothetical protein JO84_gp293 [Aureococcus anophagefferens virus]AII17228.1 hypothetical protein AaV_182 [Aureococcus anophagefferens virus]UOG94097.1 hypothetical protein MKD35_56 [Aureococcus anophagefferens virus]
MLNPAKIIEIEDHALTSASSYTHVKSAFRAGYGPSQDQIESDSFVKYGQLTKSRKRVNNESKNHNNIHPLLEIKERNVQNPMNLVEETNYDKWVRGGFPTRSVKKVSRCNIPFPQSNCVGAEQ